MVINLRVSSGNTKANTPKDWLFRAVLTKAASSCILNANVRKITRANCIPQPDSWLTSRYPKSIKRESLEHKSLQHFELLPVTGQTGKSEENRRKKETAAFPFQPFICFKRLVLPSTHTAKPGPTSFSSFLEKDSQKSPALLHYNKYHTLSPVCLLGNWRSSFHLDCRVLKSRGIFHSPCLLFITSELPQRITKCSLSFSQNQASIFF